jgi:2-oxoglutarate ferredoxin oxidoreductase subunit alpha
MATATSSPARKSGAKRSTTKKGRAAVESAVIRFAGDSDDGIQLTGDHFTQSTALVGNEFATFPGYPAEIRAPAGTTYGVSAF